MAVSVIALVCGMSADAWAQRTGAAGGETKTKPIEGPHEDLTLAVGETKTVPAAGVKNYVEGEKVIVDVRPNAEGTQLVLTGKRPGNSTLLLIRNDGTQFTYDISVTARPAAVVEREITQLIDGMPGVRVRKIGGRMFIEGGVSTEQDARRMQIIAQLYPGQVESLVQVGQGATERKLLVRLDFFYVQYQKQSGYTVGISYPGSLGGAGVIQTQLTYDFLARSTTSATATIAGQPLPRLDIAANRGWAKVLKQATIVTGNGTEAKYGNGGELNFAQNQGFSVGLVKIPYGTNLTVLPRYDSLTKDIELRMQAENSDLAPNATGTVPGRAHTHLEVLLTMKLGQALILSGIRTQQRIQSVTGLPGLSEIPVLGLLFASHGMEAQDLESAIFIVPSVVEAPSRPAMDLIKSALSTYKEFEGDMVTLETYPRTPPSATR